MFKSILRAFRVIGGPSSSSGGRYEIGENADLSCDSNGILYTRQAPASVGDHQFGSFVPAAFRGALIVSNGYLTQVGGFNDSDKSLYIQLFVLPNEPVDGDEPFMTFLVPPKASFSWEPSNGGYPHNGSNFPFNIMWFTVSSTRDVLTVDPTPIFLYWQGLGALY